MSNIIAVAIVEDGIIQNVFTNTDGGDVLVVDKDVMVNGDCPVCGQSLEPDNNLRCSSCNIDWDEFDDEEVAKMYLQGDKL
jgi:hypothetical protein